MLARRAIQSIPKTPHNHFFCRSRSSKAGAVLLVDAVADTVGAMVVGAVGLASVACVGMFGVGFGAGYVVGKRRERKHQLNSDSDQTVMQNRKSK